MPPEPEAPLTNPYAPPSAPSDPLESDAIRRAGELGFTTLVLLAANACCGFLVFLVPFTGAMALWQARGRQPTSSVDHLWMRLAVTGGWLGLGIGAVYSLFILAYLAFAVAAIFWFPGMLEV